MVKDEFDELLDLSNREAKERRELTGKLLAMMYPDKPTLASKMLQAYVGKLAERTTGWPDELA